MNLDVRALQTFFLLMGMKVSLALASLITFMSYLLRDIRMGKN